MEDLQDRLRELGEQTRHLWPLKHGFRDLLTEDTLRKIREITSEPVFIILHYRFNDEPYRGGFSLNSAFISLEAEVPEKYPYLKKYPYWQNIFDPIEETNCYLLGIAETDWLNEKCRKYEFKQRMQ